MDHHHQSSGNAGGMDLSLKIGQPFQTDAQQHDNLNHLPNFNFISQQQLATDNRMIEGGVQGSINALGMVNIATPNAMNYGMINEGINLGMSNNIGNGMANMNSVGWPLEQMENPSNYFINNGSNHMHLQYNSTTPAVGIPIMLNPQYANNFNYGAEHTISSGIYASSSSSSNSRREDSRKQRPGVYFDPNKRCTNIHCNANNTPMWRKGPLGPKTLCNACGIKYRKEAVRKRTREAENSENNSNVDRTWAN
ncbi:uncharacterized protein [Euphorbia lathyris]|uniref:uncharacterized protein n=1 Tax=Euphorbia lathyris TaxID=212925 RepID=UPI0033130AF2